MREYKCKGQSAKICLGHSHDMALAITVIEQHYSGDPNKIAVATIWLDEVQLYDLYNLLNRKIQQDGRIIDS
jgi:hypothetical protein